MELSIHCAFHCCAVHIMQCIDIVRPCIGWHWIALHWLTLYCIALVGLVLHCIGWHCIALSWLTLYCIELVDIVLHCIGWHCGINGINYSIAQLPLCPTLPPQLCSMSTPTICDSIFIYNHPPNILCSKKGFYIREAVKKTRKTKVGPK